jgi:hypothetical protein
LFISYILFYFILTLKLIKLLIKGINFYKYEINIRSYLYEIFILLYDGSFFGYLLLLFLKIFDKYKYFQVCKIYLINKNNKFKSKVMVDFCLIYDNYTKFNEIA